MVRSDCFSPHGSRGFDPRSSYQNHQQFLGPQQSRFALPAVMTTSLPIPMPGNVGRINYINHVGQWPREVGKYPCAQEPLRMYPSVPRSHYQPISPSPFQYSTFKEELFLQQALAFRHSAEPFLVSSIGQCSTHTQSIDGNREDEGLTGEITSAAHLGDISIPVPERPVTRWSQANVDPVKKQQPSEANSLRSKQVLLWIDGIPPPLFNHHDHRLGPEPLRRLPTPPCSAGFKIWEDVRP
ncbi:hypothetical protein EKO04_011593 [Ascochyta lentis]|uniref:Uncharacterized protein n=1 Tax=Ascochyta lentis TaxID=205686 RepID=A0A8H7MD88_9PLEO|nr:hypothetical protein EKO04_011593 [Ascochyta lentis]